MTRCIAIVRTHYARFFCAVLFAHVRIRFALAVRVAGFLAFVLATFEQFVAWQTAAEIVLTARNNFALFVFAVAPLCGEGHARRTVLCRMAIVCDRMFARMRTRARLIAGWTLCAAWHGRINDVRTTFTMQFIE